MMKSLQKCKSWKIISRSDESEVVRERRQEITNGGCPGEWMEPFTLIFLRYSWSQWLECLIGGVVGVVAPCHIYIIRVSGVIGPCGASVKSPVSFVPKITKTRMLVSLYYSLWWKIDGLSDRGGVLSPHKYTIKSPASEGAPTLWYQWRNNTPSLCLPL